MIKTTSGLIEEFPLQQFVDQVGYYAGSDGRRHTTQKDQDGARIDRETCQGLVEALGQSYASTIDVVIPGGEKGIGVDIEFVGKDNLVIHNCPFALCDPAVSAGGHSGERQYPG